MKHGALQRFASRVRNRTNRGFVLGLLFVLAVYAYMLCQLHIDVMAHGLYDSYTLQALAWRSGRLDLAANNPSLELAFYRGNIYVCFPPIPAFPMLLLSFFFGANTPSLWLMIFNYVGSYVVCYALGRRLGNDDIQSAVWAAFLLCGSNLIDISLFGWVWYMAQSTAFFFTLLAFFLVPSDKRREQGMGLVAIALAIGCRPMQIVYVPVLMTMVWKKTKVGEAVSKRIKAFAVLLIVPALIGLGYAIYNAVRFDDPFEFGYNYLPEFQKDAQFGLHYIPKHLKKLFLEFPSVQYGTLVIPDFDGFAFYLSNPIFLLLVVRLVRMRRKITMNEILLLVSLSVHFLLLTTHRTFGGWQFGTRYLLDLLPAVVYLCLVGRKKLTVYETPIMAMGFLFNPIGSLLFRSAYPEFLMSSRR